MNTQELIINLEKENALLNGRIRFHQEQHRKDLDAITCANNRIRELERILKEDLEESAEILMTDNKTLDGRNIRQIKTIRNYNLKIINLENKVRHYQELMGDIFKIMSRYGIKIAAIDPIDYEDLDTCCGE